MARKKSPAEIISLPMFPQLTTEQQSVRVVEEIAALHFQVESASNCQKPRVLLFGHGRPRPRNSVSYGLSAQ